MIQRLIKLIIIPLILLAFTACSDNKSQEAAEDEPAIIKEITPTAKASLANTTAAIQAQLEAQNFSTSTSTPSAARGSSASTTETYSMADVIFTIGSDDLTDDAGNPMVKNGAYLWFKENVADAGKLSDEELAEFNAATPEQFNDAFVENYYQEAATVVQEGSPNPAALLGGTAATAPAYGVQRVPKRIFGFFFKLFNPMTYMNIMVNMVKTVMTWALAQMFKVMLMSGTMTKLMLRLAIRFPILTTVMIHVLGQYWGITSRMIPYLKYDREFGELFMQLAYEQPKMAHFVFQNIDAPLYNAMTYSMLLSQETTERLAIMMNWYALYYLKTPSQGNRYDAFTNQLFFTRNNVTQDENRTISGHGDGLELANERFYYAMFSYPLSTSQFIKAMEKVDAAGADYDTYNLHGDSGHQTVVDFMDFIFSGIQETDVYGDKTGLNADRMQGSYNIFAIAQGMLTGIERAGFEAYLQNFIDFALLIPPERYLDYGQAFGMAGYTYFAQAIYPTLPTYDETREPTMLDFMLFFMGDGTAENPGKVGELLATCNDAEKVATFTALMSQVQPYINEFMQNGMPNMSMPDLSGSTAGVIIEGDANQTITTPLQQQATVIPNPSSLLDVINKFPVLWEKDYSDEGYKGDRISNDPYGYRWSEMPVEYADLNWMQIPYPNNFAPSSYFDFIFQNGEVDMYIFVKTNSANMMTGSNGILGKYSNYNMTEVTPTAPIKAINSYGQGVSFKVYRLTVVPGDQLNVYDLILFNVATGIAFDLSRAIPQNELPTGVSAEDEPTDPEGSTVEPTTPPLDAGIENTLKPEEPDIVNIFTGGEPETVEDNAPEETDQEVVEPEPEVIAEPEIEPEPDPTIKTLSTIIEGLPTSWERNNSNGNYINHYVTNENNEKWLSMSVFMSDLYWMKIPSDYSFAYNQTMHFNEATTIYFVTQTSSKSSFAFIIDQDENLMTTVNETITSDDDFDTFYVYSLEVPAGYELGSLDWIKSRTAGLAFATLAP